jgi:anhydro-N-acetylmuramic acid kinase
MSKLYKSIGLMSGTSMDGVDLALIESDGKSVIRRLNFSYHAYKSDFKNRLKALIYKHPTLAEIKLVEQELTVLHADFVNEFLAQNQISAHEIDLISFHGHTIFHDPKQKITWQLGNANLLTHLTQIDVVADFRTRDVVIGGQGAPLVPIYHFHLFKYEQHPKAILNIGGISNITYFQNGNENDMEAFDICFGNAPLDDLIKEKLGKDFDENGNLARSGEVDFILADRILGNDIFQKKPPKSFDRDDFRQLLAPINSLKLEDALATFAYMHAKALKINLGFFKEKPRQIIVCGGGRKNLALMEEMKKWLLGIEIKTAEEVGLNGDSIESEAFAFLGIRSLQGLPLSFEKTTGAKSCGGVLYRASKSASDFTGK